MLTLLPLWQLDEWHLLRVVAIWLLLWLISWTILRAHRRHLVVLFLFLPVAALACELIFRLKVFGVDGLSFDRYRPAGFASPWSNFDFDTSTYTGLKPHQSVVFKGARFTVNQHGFRGRDIRRDKPPGVYRVVVTGASVSMGAGVEDEEVVFARLERMLKESLPEKRVEVINLAMGGARMGHALHLLRHEGLSYDPDLILFFVDRLGQRDDPLAEEHLQTRKMNEPVWRMIAEPEYRFFNSRFFFFQAARQHAQTWRIDWSRPGIPHTRVQFDFRPATSRDRLDPQIVRRHFDDGLDRLEEIVGEVPVALYALRPAGRRTFGDTALPFKEYMQRVARQRDMHALVLPPEYIQGYGPHELILYPGDSHPNALHHELFADALIDDLRRIIVDEVSNREAAGRR